MKEALRYIENNYAHQVQHPVHRRSSEYRTYLPVSSFSKILPAPLPQEYLLDFRIRRACTLLKNTDLPVNDIARSVGYDDALYFSRLFRQKKGTYADPIPERKNRDRITCNVFPVPVVSAD